MARDIHSATTPTVDAPRPFLGRLNAHGFRLLMLADACTLIAALVVPMLVREGFAWPTYSAWQYAGGYALVVILHLGAYYFGGMYEREQRLGQRALLPRAASMTFGAVLIVALVELLSGRYIVPRANLAVLLVVGSLGLAGNRWLSRKLRLRREGPARVLLIGAPDDVNLARSHLGDGTARVVGATSQTDALVDLVAQTQATDMLLLSTGLLDAVYPEPLSSLERRGIGVLQRVSARDTLLGLEVVREVGGLPFVALRSHTMPVSRARFKRAFEVCGLVLTAPVTLPVLALLALYVRAVAGSPVLYRQMRVGRDGRLFRIAKFRTMHPDAEPGGVPVPATAGDRRVVPACRWLRATRMDELPQLWNVVRGEMSIVGPRPERPEMTARFEELIPGYARRHEIPPGITGLAQIQGRYHTDPEYKLGHDLQYLVNWSPVLDLQILVRTVWVVLTRKV